MPAISAPIQPPPEAVNPADIVNGSPSPEHAFRSMKALAEKHVSKLEIRDYCHPEKVDKTWKEAEVKATLLATRMKVVENILKGVDRSELVVSVVQGLGNGKTHFLLEAPRLLEVPGLYITYNGGQGLKLDSTDSGKCLLLRILFAVFGTKSFGASNFLDSGDGRKWMDVPFENLLNFTTACLKRKYGADICICVDELRKLEQENGSVPGVLSTLGHISKAMYPRICLCIVTALTDITVRTESNRPTETLKLPDVDDTAAPFFCQWAGVPQGNLWKVKRVSGYHLRSQVVSSLILSKAHVDIQALLLQTYDELKYKLKQDDVAEVNAFVKECCENGKVQSKSITKRIEVLSSRNYALPPAVLYTGLKEGNEVSHEYVVDIFSNTIVHDSAKQLEEAALSYDLLRAQWGVGVVPQCMTVGNVGKYKPLKLIPFTTRSGESLFMVHNNQVTWTGLKPEVGTYYHTQDPIHSWMDRFFVIKHGEEDWLVLAQDKINATSFADAVKKLNFAVDLIKEKIPKMKVFCIANVIGASDQTRKQDEFKCPYLLVRDHEIDDFYTVHFGPAFSFLRTRWLKSFEAKQLQGVLPQPSKKAKH